VVGNAGAYLWEIFELAADGRIVAMGGGGVFL